MLHNRTLASLMKCANLCAGKQLHCQFLIRLPPSHLLKERQNDLFFFFYSFLSYLVMPYMFTDLSKVRGHLSEDKVQFLVYQMLCGLRVSFGPFYSHTHTCVCVPLINVGCDYAICPVYLSAVHPQGWNHSQGKYK